VAIALVLVRADQPIWPHAAGQVSTTSKPKQAAFLPARESLRSGGPQTAIVPQHTIDRTRRHATDERKAKPSPQPFKVAIYEPFASATRQAPLTPPPTRGTVALTSPLENWGPKRAAQTRAASHFGRPFSFDMGACVTMNRTQRFFCATAFAFILLYAAAVAPRPSSAGDDWLPIPPADLALKDNPASPGAHAMILYRSSDMDSKESSVREYVRIKIFTQEGTNEADVELPFDRLEVNIADIHGRTIHPDGSIVNFDGKVFEKTIAKTSGVKYLAKTFTLPDVHPGSIIEYRFRELSDPNYYVNESWTITGHLYTRDAHFTIRPDSGATAALRYRQHGLPAGAIPVRQTNGTYTLDIHNLPGLEDEEYMPPAGILEAHVDFFYVSPNDPQNETPEKFWNRKAKDWSEEVDRFVNKKSALENDLSHTVSADDSPEVKLRKIYARVQKIRNLSMEEAKSEKELKQEQIKANNNVEDLLKRGYGTGRQLNYTFVGLARAAGFSAAAVFVAPRHIIFFRPELMDTSQISADIVWVHAGTQDYYLDPAASTFPFGIVPWYETSTSGVRCTKSGGEIVTIPPSPPTQATTIRTAELEIDSDGQAAGKLQVDYTGQLGAFRREQSREADDAGRRKSIGDEIQGWLPAGSTFEVTALANWDNKDLPLHIEGTAKIPNLGTAAGRRMLVPASPFQARQTSAFHPEKRLYDIYFNCPYEEIDDVKLKVPAEYKIESVPPARQAKPGSVSYEISAAQQGNVVEVKRLLVLDGLGFPATAYPALRNFFNTVKTDDDAQIVLQNAESARNN
jgi:hypothetical protein